jgi:hypothetical protein
MLLAVPPTLTDASDLALSSIERIPDLPGLGQGLGDAATVIAKRQATGQTTALPGMPIHQHVEETRNKNLGEITVHVEGYCLDCGEKIRSRSQSYAISPQIK